MEIRVPWHETQFLKAVCMKKWNFSMFSPCFFFLRWIIGLTVYNSIPTFYSLILRKRNQNLLHWLIYSVLALYFLYSSWALVLFFFFFIMDVDVEEIKCSCRSYGNWNHVQWNNSMLNFHDLVLNWYVWGSNIRQMIKII